MREPNLSAMDPQARRLLAMISLGGPHDAAQVTPADRRASFAKLMRFSRAPDAPVHQVDRTVPGRGGHMIPIRIYTPAPAVSAMPGLVFFHGGGLVAGGLETHDALCRTLAHGAACRIVAIDYRLAPEHPCPAAILDALASVRWCLRHAEALGLRRDAIGVCGDSGGATLAAAICQIMRGEGRIKAQILLCPVLDHGAVSTSRRTFASGFLLDAATMAQDLVHYAPRRPLDDPRISPLRADSLTGLPASVIHTAAFDPLVDEGAAYAARIADAGSPIIYRRHASLVHHFYALNGMIDAAQSALAQITDDIKTALI